MSNRSTDRAPERDMWRTASHRVVRLADEDEALVVSL
jgi:hypothetical protein